MAYGTEAQVIAIVGTTLQTALKTLQGGPTTTTVYTAAREDADNEINAALGAKYTVPFAAVTDTPATPGIITTLSNWLTASNLYQLRHPDGNDWKVWRQKADFLLARLVSGEYTVPSADKVDAEDGRIGLDYEAGEQVFGGRDRDYDIDRMDDW